jgi:hypothetical protein
MFRRARNQHSDGKGDSLGGDCTSEGSWGRNVGPILTSAPDPKMGYDRVTVQPDIPELLQEPSEVVLQAPPCVPEVQLEASMFRNSAKNRHSDWESNTLGPWA